jgi:hypothetical protein
MTKPLPKWVMQKYAQLWKKFRDSSFYHTDTAEILPENASVIINHLKRNRWIEISLDATDGRKRVYRLKSPEEAIMEMANEGERNRK